MLNKIDKNLLDYTKSMSDENQKVDCLVYANNYYFAKRYLKSMYENVDEYPFIKAFGISANIDSITRIANLTQVKYISSVAKVFAQMNIAKKAMNYENIDKEIFNGSGVNVAIIDTGIAEHVDFCSFDNRILHFEDFVNGKQVPYDDNGHGTFVASVLAGNGFLSGKKFSGIASKANIIMCKALDEKGETGSLTILKAMQWIYDNRERFNIRVVCMSLGSHLLNLRTHHYVLC